MALGCGAKTAGLGLVYSLGGNDAVPGMSLVGPGEECSQWARGREVTRAISPLRLSHTWQPLGATTLLRSRRRRKRKKCWDGDRATCTARTTGCSAERRTSPSPQSAPLAPKHILLRPSPQPPPGSTTPPIRTWLTPPPLRSWSRKEWFSMCHLCQKLNTTQWWRKSDFILFVIFFAFINV